MTMLEKLQGRTSVFLRWQQESGGDVNLHTVPTVREKLQKFQRKTC